MWIFWHFDFIGCANFLLVKNMCLCLCVCGGEGSAVYIVIIHCSEMLVWCQYDYKQIISGLFLLRTACLMLKNRLDPKSVYEAPLEWWLTCAPAGRVAAPLNMDVEIKKQAVSGHTHMPVDLITLHILIFPHLFLYLCKADFHCGLQS